jgi:hypothetical protein
VPKRIFLSLPFVAALSLAAEPTCFADARDWAHHPVNEWVQQSPTPDHLVPPFGWEGSGGYDPVGKQWIHHAGHDGIPQGFHLFTYDLQSHAWEQRFPPTSPPGVCCVDGSNVFDIANRRFVRFPGGMLGHGYQWSRGEKLKDSAVWLYDPAANTWTNMRPPPYGKPLGKGGPGGLNASGTYDPRSELAISFGGQESSGGTNKLFFYDAYANRLYQMEAEGAPSPRDGAGVACDSKNECLVVFGSQYASDEKTYLFRLRTGKWEAHALEPHPPARKQKTYSTIPRLAYDSANGMCLCLTWDDATGQHETWALDVAALRWTKMNPPAEPSPSMSRSRNLAYDAEHNVFLLELAPKAKNGKGAEIWTYRYRKPLPAERPAAPTGLQASAEPDRVVLTWKAASPNAKEFHVHRAVAAEPWALEFTQVGKTDRTTFEDRDLKQGQDYFYTVREVQADGSQGPASFRARTTPRVPLQPIVSVLAAGKLELRWDAHPAKDVAGYNVYRGVAVVRTVKKGEPKPWRDNDPEYAEPVPVEVRDITWIRKLNDKPLAGTSLVDDTADLAKAGEESAGYRFAVYAYLVKAVNRRGSESGPSPYALTIPSAPHNVLNREKGTTAELRWDANPEKGIAGYRIYKLQGTWNIGRLTEEPLQKTTFTHRSAGPTRYWVVAVDALGQEGEPSSPAWHQQRYDGFFKGEWHQ